MAGLGVQTRPSVRWDWVWNLVFGDISGRTDAI